MGMRKIRGLCGLFALACCCLVGEAAIGQSSAKAPEYDVVAIKPNKSGDGSMSWRSNNDSFSVTNLTLKQLLVNAYGIREGLISGIPAWAENARFDIKAKVADPDVEVLKKLSPEQRRAMVAAILTERFGLKVHPETKQLPVYELTVWKDGPKFKESVAQPVDPGADPKGPKTMGRGSVMTSNGDFTSVGVPISSMVTVLANELNRTVIDKTGLAGAYDLHLKWTPERAAAAGAENGQQAADAAPPLFTALQEQLGLKLVATKGPVETLVVDHVEQPTEN